VGASSEIGTRWPAHATSTGKVLLADRRLQRKATRGRNGHSRVARRRLRGFTSRTITEPARLERELSRALDRGWATAVEELEEGYAAVGAPVRDHDGRAVAAISVGGPSARLTKARIPELARRVVRAADRTSRHLGHREIRAGASAPH
jgi:DNA-binding IclR family transcriptional regulator